jgi:cyclic-di-GMP-binding protein
MIQRRRFDEAIAVKNFELDQVWLAEPDGRHLFSGLLDVNTLVEQLPKGDSGAVLHKVTEWLRQIIQIPDFPLQEQLDVIDVIDRLAKNHQFNLVPEYLDTPRMRKLSESHIWTTSFEFWQALSDAYLHCLNRFQAGEEGSKEFKAGLPRVSGRIIRSLTLQLKWTLLRYGRVEDRLWRDLGRTYLLAANWGFAIRRSAIYPGRHGESTVQEELLKALMLSISAPNSLNPLQQHVAERVIAHFGSRFALHSTPGPGCTFIFDLSMHAAPTRAHKGNAPAPLIRFFGPGTALEGLHQLSGYLKQHGALPIDTGIGDNYDVKVVASVLEHLGKHWTDSAVPRRGKRSSVMTRLTVVPGFTDAVRWLDGRFNLPVKAQLALPSSESWVVFDASDGGFGAVIPTQSADWVEIGALIAVQPESSSTYRMGVLRRISKEANDECRVGIEFIGEQAVPVKLSPLAGHAAPASLAEAEVAILLSRQPDAQGAISLLLKTGHMSYVKARQMKLRAQVFVVEQQEVIDRGRDYQWVSFKLSKTE